MSHFGDLIGVSSPKPKPTIVEPEPVVEETPLDFDKMSKSELELYGSPSISTANEDVRWQNVSCSTYSFKQDEKLFGKAAKEKMIVNNIDHSREGEFVRELNIEEGERYYHRDVNLQPFWYEFRTDSQGYFPPNMSDKGDGLLVQSTDLLVKIFEGLKSEFRKLLDPDSDSIMIINLFNLFK